jgi:hypothetical protein
MVSAENNRLLLRVTILYQCGLNGFNIQPQLIKGK